MATSTTTTTTTSSIMLQHEENCNEEQVIRLQPPTDENKEERLNQIDELKYFLGTATNDWEPNRQVQSFPLPTGESLSCVFWNNLFHVTGTDIVRTLLYRFHLFGRPVTNLKKFEEGIFSDLRNLKPGMDASLEEPKSEFLEMLYKNNCIRTQKKQKVFFWFSVPHDRLFLDALERDLKREKINLEPTSIAIAEPATSLSLDTTQELFDQLRKSMSLSAVAAAHAMDDIPHSNITTTSNNNNTNSTNTTTTTTITTTTTTADDHNASYSHDNDDWTSWNQQKSNTIERTGHRPTRSLSSITLPPNIVSNPQEYEQTSFSAGTSPKSDHFELYPSFDKDESEKQKIFGAFSLFEGSPTYKQRQRRRTLSFNTAGYLDEDYQGTRLELAAINAGLAIINPHNLFQQSNHQHDHTGTEKVYTCPLPQCARIFKRLEHLKRHFRTHTLERPYSCNMCGKHFSRTDNLAQHKKTHNRTRSISVLTRCNSSAKLITLTNKSSDTSNPTTRKRASSLRNNCNEVIDKLSALSSDDNIHPNTTTTATENSIAPVDYFSYQGGDDISRYTNSLSPSGSNHQSDEEVLFNNTNFEQVIPYQMMDEDVYMADENEVNNNNVMYEDESYDTCGPYLPQPTASTSSSFMWQQPADPPCSTTSSSSSLLFNNNNNNHNNQQYYHRLSWYSSMDDKSVSPKSSSPSSLYDNTQTYSWHQT